MTDMSNIDKKAVNALRGRVGFWAPLAAVLVGFLYLTVMCAWQSDDAYLTYRTVRNALEGHGLTWNAGERVQAYTHPLWMMAVLCCHAIFEEIFFSTLGLSILLTLLTVLILFRIGGRGPALVAAALLSVSASFVDYAACGLENPLLNLLLVLFVWRFHYSKKQRKVLWLSLLACLIGLTRMDALLITGPVLIGMLVSSQTRLRSFLVMVAGFLPLLAWELFSLVYYGALVPNTALAKLNLDIPTGEIIIQGFVYLADSLLNDPVSLLTIAAALFLAFWRGGREHKLLAIGIGLYLAYVVAIGGDFMSGRFLAAPLLCALANVAGLMSVIKLKKLIVRASLMASLIAALLGYGLLWPNARWTSGPDFGAGRTWRDIVSSSGIADERAYYYPTTGLVPVLGLLNNIQREGLPLPPYRRAIEGQAFLKSAERVQVVKEVGMFAYFAGPDKFIIDVWSLGDPFLARIPFKPIGKWRIGHFERPLPAGYVESRQNKINAIKDPDLAKAYDAIWLVNHGPLFSGERWSAIWRLNTGYFERAFKNAGL